MCRDGPGGAYCTPRYECDGRPSNGQPSTGRVADHLQSS